MTDQGLIDWLNILSTKRYILDTKKAHFEAENKDLIDDIAEIETKVREAVLEKGETVKAEKMSAVWVKGKTTWDGKILEGYAVAHPEILAAKKTGKPTVSFKINK